MPQPKNRPQRPESLGRLLVPLVSALNLQEPVVVAVPDEIALAVRRYFVLEVNVRNGRAVVVGVKMLVGGNVLEPYAREVGDVLQWLRCPVKVGTGRSIGDGPVVIGVTVRVECNLLFWKCFILVC